VRSRFLTQEEQRLLQHALSQLRKHRGDKLYGQLWWEDGKRLILIDSRDERLDQTDEVPA